MSRLKETALKRGVQTADSRIISPATQGVKVAPRTARLTALGSFAGAAIGVCLLMLQLHRVSAVPTATQLEAATDFQVLGHLPKAPIRGRKQLVGYLADNPMSPLAEAARNLRTSLLMGNKQIPPKVILVTSSVPDEGKTTTAIALAHNLAGLGRSVLLIEADIRRLSFRNYFGECPDGGLVKAVSEQMTLSELIHRDGRTGVDILMGGNSPRSAADLFSAPKFHAVLQELKRDYDHIVIDSPPVLAVPDARVVGQSVDAILLVVAAAHTSRDQVQQALREFSSVNLSVTGLVMSDLGSKAQAAKSNSYGTYAQYYVT